MAKGTIGLGQYRGKVGGQVLRVVDGKQVLQSYQPNVRNPRTTAQQMQRSAMRKLGSLSRGLLVALREGFGGVYPSSEFIKKNIPSTSGALTSVTATDATVNYGSLMITNEKAKGLVVINAGTADFGETQHLRVACDCTTTLASGVDASRVRLRMVIYSPDLNMSVMSQAIPLSTTSAPTQVDVVVPASFDGMEVYGWVFAAISENGIDPDAYDTTNPRLPKSCTNTSYLGQGEIA